MHNFYKNKRVFITGHTGFKGSWLCEILTMFGANVKGYSREPEGEEALYRILKIDNKIQSVIGDIRDLKNLKKEILSFKPDIVFHLAAQPIVRESYNNPVYTYETNVMGTVNLLESIRYCDSVKSVVNITTDKVYKNNEWEWGYRECDELNGFDPYSNSKSCSELVTSSYKKSFFNNSDIAISTARAGNVIGGGDFAKDRIIPDCIRYTLKNESIVIRNPKSIRPYQHVFEALRGYLMIAEKQYKDKNYEGAYNIGPDNDGCIYTEDLVKMFCNRWGSGSVKVVIQNEKSVHEANYLKLDCSKIRNKIGWNPILDIEDSIKLTVDWTKTFYEDKSICEFTENQIQSYFIDKREVISRNK